MNQTIEEILPLINKRAENLVLTHRSMCAESVLPVLSQVFGGALSHDMVARLTSGLSEGFGGSGCICGALNGSALALGLFLGRDSSGFTHRRKINSATQSLHDRFRGLFGSTCCRVLTKKNGNGRKRQFDHCARLTGKTAELAAEIILENRPELIHQADWEYLNQSDGKVMSQLKRVADLGAHLRRKTR